MNMFFAKPNTDYRSISRRRQLGKAWRLRLVKADAIPRLRFDVRRNTILYVARNMCCRTIYSAFGYLVSWMRDVRAVRTDPTL